ncbi:MAG: hypothetical protein HQM08_26020 [Candidatus Riflebacteria bacterium]|nr:hypothetical protein [Candidatus Riflebacteria bacterium]
MKVNPFLSLLDIQTLGKARYNKFGIKESGYDAQKGGKKTRRHINQILWVLGKSTPPVFLPVPELAPTSLKTHFYQGINRIESHPKIALFAWGTLFFVPEEGQIQ